MRQHIVSDIEYIAGEIFLMKSGEFLLSGTAPEIIATMPQRVWSAVVPKAKIETYLGAFQVSNIKTVPGGAELRILSVNPPTGNAIEQSATLEDVFLYYFGEKGDGSDGEI